MELRASLFHHPRQYRGRLRRSALAALLLTCLSPAFAQQQDPADPGPEYPAPIGDAIAYHPLPAPPKPSSSQFPTKQASAIVRATLAPSRHRGAGDDSNRPRVYAAAPGAPANRKTLVLYDNSGDFAWLGEAYAVMTGQLASRGGAYVLRPVDRYQASEIDGYTAVVYLGSTYDAALPTVFLDDVLASSKPVLWMNYNIWQLAARAPDFAARYGWAPQFIDFASYPTVDYKNVALLRDPHVHANGLVASAITDPAKAATLASARTDTGTQIPWAVRGGNLTFISEIPFTYVSADDRYLAAADLIAGVANPDRPDRKRALVRIEDVGPDADSNELRKIADYLRSRRVPFSVAVYPAYRDLRGVHSAFNWPQSTNMWQRPFVSSAIRYMQDRGGTLVMHGYTHQYGRKRNPYNGVSKDDFEFYTAHIDENDRVIYDGPVAEDSRSWALGRLDASRREFSLAWLSVPTIFEFPHYAGSAVDYQAVRSRFSTRYDRGLYAANWCAGGDCGSGKPDYSRIYGQFFPFAVRDIFDSIVLPESLGNIELEEMNGHPPRLPADILASAQRNAVIQDGVQSFFFHPSMPIEHLKAVVEGLQGMGYQFVAPNDVAKQ